ncbi:MAG: T9SS type A sorting domain-containing protein [Flavobacteriaceae bacterium]|nr:T9SS type A sorting domain-containing protein [Flavobacteriaceae bacterium]
MIKKITLLFIAIITSVTFAQTTIGESDLFNTTTNTTWTHVFTAVTTSDGVAVSGLAQTVVINITDLPSESETYRIYKTTQGGQGDFDQQGSLILGENTITVPAVTFNRAVKFQFSGGGLIQFDSFSHNGVVLYPTTSQECEPDDVTIGTSDSFVALDNDDWPFYLTAASIVDDGTNMNTDHSFEMNITCMPDEGASYRIYKTNSTGNDITCCVGTLSLGENSKVVAGVSWNRNLRFQFSSGDIGYSSLSVNGTALGLDDLSFSDIMIYPNPATDIIFVGGIQNIKSIKIYSILGSLEKEVFNTNQVDISELSTGIHFIKVDNGTVFTKKMIKQ